MPPPTAPDSGEITLSEAARRLGLSVQSCGMWARRPGAPARAEGRHVYVTWPAFARWREQALIEAAAPGDVEALRAEKLRVEIDHARLQLARDQGQVVTIADYETALGRALDFIMARVRQMPTRCAHLGPDVEAVLEDEVEALVRELHESADTAPDVLSAEPDDAAPTTTPHLTR